MNTAFCNWDLKVGKVKRGFVALVFYEEKKLKMKKLNKI